MHKETGRAEAPRSAEELKDLIDQANEVTATFGKNSQKGLAAIERRRGLEAELAALESTEAKRSQAPAPERAHTQPSMAVGERQQREKMEDANQLLAEMTSNLLSWKFSQPELGKVLERLRDPKMVEDFLRDRRGTEFFLQGVNGLKAKDVATRALEQFYQKATRRPYQQTRAA